jgi:Fe-S-cluster-containing hydrogenase component 2
VENIEMDDGKPVWSDHCAGCFACLQWCPKETITLGGSNPDIKSYHHPEVSLKEMIRQRSATGEERRTGD